jgi:hypothetical protein
MVQTTVPSPIYGKTLLATLLTSAVLLASGSALLPNAEAVMLAQDIVVQTLKNQQATVNLSGSANYPTFHYVIVTQPQNGKIVSLDAETGKVLYQPNSGFAGIDSFRYRIASDFNDSWTSNTATVKIAVAEPWKQYCNDCPITPVQLSQYVKAKSLTAVNMPDAGAVNFDRVRATPEGQMAYVNAKIAYELANGPYSWWTLDLGQKAWMMEKYCDLLDKTDLWLNPRR